MDEGPPTIALFGFSAAFALAAVVYIRYAEQIKRWNDNHALFQWQLQTNRTISVSTYRLGGWISALCSLAMFLLAIAQWCGL
jgi:hypothetical protein